MLRIITNEDKKFGKRMNGEYAIVYFSASGLSVGSGKNIIYFKFEDEVKTELIGNEHFTADGYLYDVYNNTTSTFTYRPQISIEMQKLEFKNVKNVKISFYDRNYNAISLPNWIFILKKV